MLLGLYAVVVRRMLPLFFVNFCYFVIFIVVVLVVVEQRHLLFCYQTDVYPFPPFINHYNHELYLQTFDEIFEYRDFGIRSAFAMLRMQRRKRHVMRVTVHTGSWELPSNGKR